MFLFSPFFRISCLCKFMIGPFCHVFCPFATNVDRHDHILRFLFDRRSQHAPLRCGKNYSRLNIRIHALSHTPSIAFRHLHPCSEYRLPAPTPMHNHYSSCRKKDVVNQRLQFSGGVWLFCSCPNSKHSYNIAPPTTATTIYAIRLQKVSAN